MRVCDLSTRNKIKFKKKTFSKVILSNNFPNNYIIKLFFRNGIELFEHFKLALNQIPIRDSKADKTLGIPWDC